MLFPRSWVVCLYLPYSWALTSLRCIDMCQAYKAFGCDAESPEYVVPQAALRRALGVDGDTFTTSTLFETTTLHHLPEVTRLHSRTHYTPFVFRTTLTTTTTRVMSVVTPKADTIILREVQVSFTCPTATVSYETRCTAATLVLTVPGEPAASTYGGSIPPPVSTLITTTVAVPCNTVHTTFIKTVVPEDCLQAATCAAVRTSALPSPSRTMAVTTATATPPIS